MKRKPHRAPSAPASRASPVPPPPPANPAPSAKKSAPARPKRPQPAPAPAASDGGKRARFPVVGIGASAGGLEALEELLSHMPPDTNMAFVIVTHQHPGHVSLLPELLAKATTLPVVEAANGLRLEPNHVYVCPPHGQLALLHGVLHHMEDVAPATRHLPIDYFFRSLAQDQKENAICIILSGTGTDGTLGLKAVKGESGMVMVQQAQSAKYGGMPSSAAATGLADYVLPPRAMPKQLVAYARGPYLAAAAAPTEAENAEVPAESMQNILLLLRARTGNDFSSYKASTIRRRIERRMNLHQIKDPNQYGRYLKENAPELDFLFKELLISVTSFFRDPEAFDSLATSALPALIKSRPDDYTLRIWVPGCATGEEVYSLAILFRETMDTLKRHLQVQLFGTDLDRQAIGLARNGVYPDGIGVDVASPRLERCFIREDGLYRIRKEIREMTIFAIQNVIKDPPFTKLDLISCRNLLIYLNGDLQKRLFPMFHYALRAGGLLMLGPSETIGGFGELFEVVDKKWKIFRRKESALAVHPTIEFPVPSRSEAESRVQVPARPPRESSIVSIIERILLHRFVPASVVVNDRGDVVCIHGRTGAYLEPSAGQPRMNIVDMAREGLQLELGVALRQAAARDEEVTRENIRVRTNGGFSHVNLSIVRLHDPESVRGLFLVTFQSRPITAEAVSAGPRARRAHAPSPVKELERELHYTKESLQTTIEELETSNEELKSSNEELQSTNEELQSTNEELETSKEELQSLNEELTTVNTEMQSKVDDLSRANDDMQNLLNSTEVATIFLDNELNIKRFTDQAKRLINLIPSDIGRPLADLASSLRYENLVADCREILRTLVFRQAEVQTKDGHWYLMRIMPYRTAENVINGLVLTFVDTHPLHETQRHLRRMSKVFLDAMDPIIIVDLTGNIIDLNEEASRTYGWSRTELLGQPVTMLVPPAQRGPMTQRLQDCRAGRPIRNVECVRLTKDGREVVGINSFSLLNDERGAAESIAIVARHVKT